MHLTFNMRAIKPKIVFLIVFLFFLIANIKTMVNPPYWDGIMGVFNQAVWLEKNGFDYVALSQQPGFLEGGANVNIFYLLALIYGLLYTLFPLEIVFLIAHLITIFCATVTFVLIFLLLEKWMSPVQALLWCAAGALNPIWSGQCAAIYLDLPQAAVFVAVIYALCQEQYGKGCFWCIFAYFIKSAALLLGLAMFAWFWGLIGLNAWFVRPRSHKSFEPQTLFLLLPLPLFMLLNQAVKAASDLAINWNPSAIAYMAKTQFPSLILLGIGGILLSFMIFARKSYLRGIQRDYKKAVLLGFLGIFIYGFWLSFIIYRIPLCRYVTVIIFPMMAFTSLMLVSLKYTRVSYIIPVILIVFYSLNQYGQLFPPVQVAVGRSGEILERSREFLIDLDANRNFCSRVEQNYFDRPIVTKWPFYQMLTMPEMGYIKRPLPNVHAVGYLLPYANVSDKEPPEILKQADALYLYAANTIQVFWSESYTPQKGDAILLEDMTLGAPVWLYKKREQEMNKFN